MPPPNYFRFSGKKEEQSPEFLTDIPEIYRQVWLLEISRTSTFPVKLFKKKIKFIL